MSSNSAKNNISCSIPLVVRCMLMVLFSVAFLPRLSAQEIKTEFYDRWTLMPTEQLVDKGREFMDKKEKLDSATVCFTIVANRYYKKRAIDQDAKFYILAMLRLGYIYEYQYFDYSKACIYLQQALSLSEESGITSYLPSIYLNIGTLRFSSYIAQHDNKRAYGTMSYLKKAFYSAQKEQKYATMLTAFTDLLNLVLFHGDTKDIKKEIDVFRRQKFPKLENLEFTRLFCGVVEAKSRGEVDESLRLLSEMESLVNREEAKSRHLLIIYTSKANILNDAKRYQEALECVKQEVRIAEDFDAKDVLGDAYQSMSELYETLGDKQKAEYYELLSYRQKDSLLSESRLGKVSEYEFMYRLKKASDKIDEIDQQRRQQQTVLIAVMAVAAVVIVSLIIVVINFRRLRENHRRLYEKNLELLRKESDERRARELNEQLLAELKESQSAETLTEKTKYASSSMDGSDKERLLSRIRKIMESSDEIFREDFSLARLAELTDTHQRYVSQVLNEQDGMNFKTMLNDYRIKEVCRRISSGGEYANYSIEAIAESVGFKSRTYFSSLFKRMTGLTPSEYQRQAKSDK